MQKGNFWTLVLPHNWYHWVSLQLHCRLYRFLLVWHDEVNHCCYSPLCHGTPQQTRWSQFVSIARNLCNYLGTCSLFNTCFHVPLPPQLVLGRFVAMCILSCLPVWCNPASMQIQVCSLNFYDSGSVGNACKPSENQHVTDNCNPSRTCTSQCFILSKSVKIFSPPNYGLGEWQEVVDYWK